MNNQKGFGVTIIVAIIAIGIVAGFLSVSLNKPKNNRSLPVIPPVTSPSAAPQAQGVKGTITHRTGDCMPTTVGSRNSCSVRTFTDPLTVIIKQSSQIIKQIPQVKGEFQLELPAGVYSMFVLYQNKEYCTSTDQNGVPCAFTVEPNKLTNHTFQINDATD